MARYIDAEELICSIDGSECLDTERDYEEVLKRIDETPTADVAEVRHGHWIRLGERSAKCSACGEIVTCNGYDKTNKATIITGLNPRCRLCGARMNRKAELTEKKMLKFWLNGCDIAFIAKAPADITLEELLKQADKIKPHWCACGICSYTGDSEAEIIFDYTSVKKANEEVSCDICETDDKKTE